MSDPKQHHFATQLSTAVAINTDEQKIINEKNARDLKQRCDEMRAIAARRSGTTLPEPQATAEINLLVTRLPKLLAAGQMLRDDPQESVTLVTGLDDHCSSVSCANSLFRLH